MIVTEVEVANHQGLLGTFKWDKQQRIYLFQPFDDWQFSPDQLREFADLAEKLTKRYGHKNTKCQRAGESRD